MAQIRLSHITRFWHLKANKRKKLPERDVYALRDVSVTIEDGEFVVLVGPSGCGKTTLLRVIAGLEEQNKGKVYIGGKNADELAPNRRGVALVFQEYALYPHLTAFGNMALPLLNDGMPKEEVSEYVARVAKQLDIEYLLNRRPKRMSWGQRQRVSLGRAICRRPGIMLLDEPLSGADEELRAELRDTIRSLHDEYGFTCIYVTHRLEEALSLADRIIEMEDGRIVSDKAPDAFAAAAAAGEAEGSVFESYEGSGITRFDPKTGRMIMDSDDGSAGE